MIALLNFTKTINTNYQYRTIYPAIRSGYLGLFKSPHTILHPESHSTVFCMSTHLSDYLILMPLVPNFFAEILKSFLNHTANKIYLIAPDISIPFVSDYYNTWYYFKKTLGIDCKIISMFPIENYASSEFKNDVIVTGDEMYSIVIPLQEYEENTSINIQFSRWCVKADNPFTTNVIIHDTNKKILFVSEMNESLADYLSKPYVINKYDEIHMPYIIGNYQQMSYSKLVQKFHPIASKIRITQFGSIEEMDMAKNKGIAPGRLWKL